MEAKWLQNGSLEASGRPLGADSASRGSPEPSWRGSGAARGSPKSRCWRLGGLLGRKVGRFHASGGPPEGPGEAPGGHFGGIFAERPGGTEKVIHLLFFFNFIFGIVFWLLFVSISSSSWRRRRESAPKENRFSLGGCCIFRMSGVCARSQKEKEL